MLRFPSLTLFSIGVFAMTAAGQTGPGDPFHAKADNGEVVRVLPPPAAVGVNGRTQQVDAPPSSATSVYPASYGFGKLRNHGGPQIPNANFQAIYWNSQVANSTATSLGYGSIKAQIDAFISSFADGANWHNATTDDYTIIQQYGTSNSISNTLFRLQTVVDNKAGTSTISDSAIQNYLTTLFTTTNLPASDTTLYGIYFPSGMQVTMGNSASCSSFCGYHSHYSYGGHVIKYAVFPYPDCSGCSLSGKSVADMLTIVSSHEIREAVTDSLGNAWYDLFGYEADDKCAWHNLYQMAMGGFWVQPEYSNGGTVTASGFTATYPGPGCVVPK